MKVIRNLWPWFAFLSVVIFVVSFFVDYVVLEASWYFLSAITFLLIILDIRTNKKNKLNKLAFIVGGFAIISFFYQGITILM